MTRDPSGSVDTLATVTGRRVAPGRSLPGEFTYSIVEIAKPRAPALEAAGERRGDARQRTRLRDAVLGERHHRVLADCRIKDRSRAGARLQLDAERTLPKSFILTEPASQRSFRAVLVWQKGRDAGVRLVPLDEDGGNPGKRVR